MTAAAGKPHRKKRSKQPRHSLHMRPAQVRRLRKLPGDTDASRLQCVLQMAIQILSHPNCSASQLQNVTNLVSDDIRTGKTLGGAMRRSKGVAGSCSVRYSPRERALMGDLLERLPHFSPSDLSTPAVQRSLVGVCLDLVESNAAIVGVTGLSQNSSLRWEDGHTDEQDVEGAAAAGRASPDDDRLPASPSSSDGLVDPVDAEVLRPRADNIIIASSPPAAPRDQFAGGAGHPHSPADRYAPRGGFLAHPGCMPQHTVHAVDEAAGMGHEQLDLAWPPIQEGNRPSGEGFLVQPAWPWQASPHAAALASYIDDALQEMAAGGGFGEQFLGGRAPLTDSTLINIPPASQRELGGPPAAPWPSRRQLFPP